MRITQPHSLASILIGLVVAQGAEPKNTTHDVETNGAANRETFDEYLREGFSEISEDDPYAQVVVVNARTINYAVTRDPASLVAMMITAWLPESQKGAYVKNWDGSELHLWSPLKVGPVAPEHEHLKPWIFNHRKRSLASIFYILYREGKISDWSRLIISQFKNPPTGHDDEIFYAFRDPSAPEPRWTYVGDKTGNCLQDDSPFVIGRRPVDGQANNRNMSSEVLS